MVCFSCLPGAPPNLETILRRVLRDPEGCDIDDLFAATGALAGIVTESVVKDPALYRSFLAVKESDVRLVHDAIESHVSGGDVASRGPTIEEIATHARARKGDVYAKVETGVRPGDVTSALGFLSLVGTGLYYNARLSQILDLPTNLVNLFAPEAWAMLYSPQMALVFCAGWAGWASGKRALYEIRPGAVRKTVLYVMYVLLAFLSIMIVASVTKKMYELYGEEAPEKVATVGALEAAQTILHPGNFPRVRNNVPGILRTFGSAETNPAVIGADNPTLFATVMALAADGTQRIFNDFKDMDTAVLLNDAYTVMQANRKISSTDNLNMIKCLKNNLPEETVDNLQDALRESVFSAISAGHLEDSLEVSDGGKTCIYRPMDGGAPVTLTTDRVPDGEEFMDFSKPIIRDVFRRYDTLRTNPLNNTVTRMVGNPVFAAGVFKTVEDFKNAAETVEYLADVGSDLPTNFWEWVRQGTTALTAVGLPCFLFYVHRMLARQERRIAEEEGGGNMGILARVESLPYVGAIVPVSRGTRDLMYYAAGPITPIVAGLSAIQSIAAPAIAAAGFGINQGTANGFRLANALRNPDPMLAAGVEGLTLAGALPGQNSEFFFNARQQIMEHTDAYLDDASPLVISQLMLSFLMSMYFRVWQNQLYGNQAERRWANYSVLLTLSLAGLNAFTEGMQG